LSQFILGQERLGDDNAFDNQRFRISDERSAGQYRGYCAAIAVLLAIAVFLVECSGHPSLLEDAATTSIGP
jgi:hypothetical protein